MLSELDADGFVDVADNLTDDIAEPADTSDQVDKMLDTMSLDELHKLREDLTNGNIADISDLRPMDNLAFMGIVFLLLVVLGKQPFPTLVGGRRNG